MITEREKHYRVLNEIELKLYGLQLKLTKHVGNAIWNNFENNLLNLLSGKMRNKTLKLKNKFEILYKSKNPKELTTPTKSESNIINLTNHSFNKQETDFLDKGLKTCVKYPNQIEDYIADIQTATKHLDENEKIVVKNKCEKVLRNMKLNCKSNNIHNPTIKSLKEKPVIYTKADKGNQIVILDNDDYKNRMEKLLENEEYLPVKNNPLNSCVKSLNEALKKVRVIPEKEKYLVKPENPTLPRMYGLPKVHKNDNSMRPIINNIGSPTYKLAKWLVDKFNSFPKFKSSSIKNSFEVIEKLKDVKINKEDILVSFDVKALFPSIPIKEIPHLLKTWLQSIEMEPNDIEDYIRLTTVCLEQNFFKFNNKFFQQKSGLAMGNPLSPFLADLFMSSFENLIIEGHPLIFKMWLRYVDDILAIVPKKLVDDSVKLLNLHEKSIKFTVEIETNGYLPFLDLKIIRNNDKIEFGIHRKSTHGENYIKSNSHNPKQHQHAVFNSLIHRLENTPLTTAEYQAECQYILQLAETNGFQRDLIHKKIQRAKQQKVIKETTTLSTTQDFKYKKFSYHPRTFYKFNKIFRQHNIRLAPINKFSIKNILNSKTKDIIPPEEKSGIYQINCNDCDKIYIGKTKRNIQIRAKEHIRNIKFFQTDKSAVATHFWQTYREMDLKPKFLKPLNNKTELDIWEKSSF